jgi:hypothetical protein
MDARNGESVYRFTGGGAIVGGVIPMRWRETVRRGSVRHGGGILAGAARRDDVDRVCATVKIAVRARNRYRHTGVRPDYWYYAPPPILRLAIGIYQ